MTIQGLGRVAQYHGSPLLGRQGSALAAPASAFQDAGTQVTLSGQAKALASSDAVQSRLDQIKATPAAQRSSEDVDFLYKNDPRLAEIRAKGQQAQTADDIDYMQKTGGFVNTMANLSPAEKQLYDELVAKGETEAVRGMNLLAMSRMMGGDVTLPNGKTFDPTHTEITADNVRQLFSQMFADADGADARSFEALASYLDGRA